MIKSVRGTRDLLPPETALWNFVESTARDAFMRDFHVVFPSDASATYYEAAHVATLNTIGMHFGEISSVAEIESLWRPVPCHSPLSGTPTTATLHA